MKLRNKKTGELCELGHIRQAWREEKDGGMGYMFLKANDNNGIIYNSLAEMMDEWEDYKPAEPLIKDEKIREFIRDWAEINGIKVVLVCQTFNAWGVKNKANGNLGDEEHMCADILFRGEKPKELEFGKEYTIPELCGEEKE